MRFYLSLAALLLISVCCFAAGKKIDKETLNTALNTTVCPIDSEANAYVVFENHTIDITVEKIFSSYYYLQTEHIHRVIKILNKSATDVANIHIVYPAEDNQNYLFELAATTYNKEGANVQEIPLNKTDFYKKEITRHTNELSFSFPSVKAGSVIEYSYTQVSRADVILPVWTIQEDYPKLLSLFEVSYPTYLPFTSIAHTALPIKKCPSRQEALKCPEEFANTSYDIYQGICNFWVRKNIPALRDEPFVNNITDHSEELMLQLKGNTWKLFNTAMQKSHIVSGIDRTLSMAVDDLLTDILHSAPQPIDTMQAIYSYVRSRFTADEERTTRIHRIATELIRTHVGNNAEINMLLCSLLTKAGLNAYPIVLSTVGNRSATPAFPIIGRFNYLACAVKNGSGYTMLDASDKYTAYGMLPAYCYNGFAWIVNDEGAGINLDPSLISEKNVTYVKIDNFSDSSADLEVTFKAGLTHSANLRRSWAADKKQREKYIDNLSQGLASGTTIDDVKVLNETNPDTNLVIIRKGKLSWGKNADHLFFNTSQFSQQSNPFTASVRHLPIEYPYQLRDYVAVNMKLPDNMEPGELPPPAEIRLDSSAIVYRKSYNHIAATHTFLINSIYDRTATSFDSDHYALLRDFLSNVMKKENEIITLKKTK